MRVDGVAGGVEGPAEVVGGCLRPEIRPEPVHDPLPVQAVFRVESQQLDQRRRLSETPFIPLDGPTPHPDRKPAEQPHTNRLLLVRVSVHFPVHHRRRLLLTTMITTATVRANRPYSLLPIPYSLFHDGLGQDPEARYSVEDHQDEHRELAPEGASGVA